MRAFLFGAATLVAGTLAGLGPGWADEARSPVYKAVQKADSWSGFYVGANAGYGVAKDPSRQLLTDPRQALPFADTFALSPAGGFVGLQAGYNWQVSRHWVLGVEADLQTSAQKDSSVCVTACTVTLHTMVTQQLPWFGTLRARAGWTNGPTLYYVTGGAAVGKVTTDYAVQVTNAFDFHSFSQTRTGWTAGAGIETRLAGNWTAKIEYLHVDLGSITNTFAYAPFPAATYVETSALRNHVTRIGLNYKFGEARTAPVMPAGAGWTGFHAGANLGFGITRSPSEAFLNPVNGTFPDETFNVVARGALGGGQIGFRSQMSQWVWGVEADLQASEQRDSTTCVTGCIPQAPSLNFTQVAHKLPWFGTVRAQLGWSNGPALFYLTGGWAAGRVTRDYTVQLGGAVDAHSFSSVQSGWTAGAGIETQLVGPWSVKLEYLYVDLGKVSDVFAYSSNPAITYRDSSSIRNHVVRAGLNYRFAGR